ncbi:MAG: 50S ribosomal protein L5 [Planctomycetia bacterium]|nr:MAG: 50S ribosomal protein L5 [Planctomycetia bacterium]
MARMLERYSKEIAATLKQELGRDNVMAVPKLDKIVLSMGLGKCIADAGGGSKTRETKRFQEAEAAMTTIAGQKPLVCKSKKAVANFKLRDGWAIGLKVTLRGRRMYEFLDRLVALAVPRIRDFRGLDPNGFDGRGNYGMGLAEYGVFPEIHPDKITFQQGLNITICTTAGNDAGARRLLTLLGMPFRS